MQRGSESTASVLRAMRYVAILGFLLSVATLNAHAENRLVGAKPVAHNDYDWVAAVYPSAAYYSQPCTGVLVKQQWVLTTAECVRDNLARELTVILGRNDLLSTKGEVHRVTKVVANSLYLNFSRPDMALLELSRPSSIRAVEMLPATARILPGKNLLLTGFGISNAESFRLKRKVLVRATNPRHCDRVDVLCAGNRKGVVGASSNDRGTPVLVKHRQKWKLAGLVNSLLDNEGYTFERSPWPQNYLDLSTQRDWIDRQLTDNSIDGETTDLMSREAKADIYCYELRCDYDARRSTDGRIGFLGHSWNFGDGIERQGAVITHKYESPGRYSIELNNQLVDGTTTTQTRSVLVRERKILRGRQRNLDFRGYASRIYESASVFPNGLTEGLYVYKGPIVIALENVEQTPGASLNLRIEQFDVRTQQWSQIVTNGQPRKSNGELRLNLKRSGFLKFHVTLKNRDFAGFRLRVKATVSKEQCQRSYECSSTVYSDSVAEKVQF